MNWREQWKPLALIVALFLGAYYLPVGSARFDNAVLEAFYLLKWYAREHVLLCLIPAFFIAGAIGVFVSKGAVMKYLGANANKVIAYAVASASGSILAVCSCTVLPLFLGIYRMGAGLGPAVTFLYSGPAINVLAIILTARVLGMELGIARAVGAILFSIIIGLAMQWIYRREEAEKATIQLATPDEPAKRSLGQNGIFFAVLIGILVFANWGAPVETSGFWFFVHSSKWIITGVLGLVMGLLLAMWFGISWWKLAITAVITLILAFLLPGQPTIPFTFAAFGLSYITATNKEEGGQWFASTWEFAKQILPLLLIGVLIAGAALGRVGHEGLILSEWIASAVGGNSLWANFFASFAGAFMYFATLTEVPILQGLIGSGMGKGPALALLLAGPALSLPSMLVIRGAIGTKKTVVFVSLVIVMATISGLIFGTIFDV